MGHHCQLLELFRPANAEAMGFKFPLILEKRVGVGRAHGEMEGGHK